MDKYLNEENCYQRLKEEYEKYGKLIVAVDHDNTVYDFHQKGLEFNDVIELVKDCNKLNFDVVVFTANKNHESIKWYWYSKGIKFKGININVLPQFEGSGKIFYSILLDDRAGLGESYRILKRLTDEIKED